jgi:hypothetical protein
MSRLPALGFAALVVATVAAFFVTQHLKVTTPLIAGAPAAVPSWINPVDGVTCGPPTERVNHRVMKISFYLLHRSDDVDVYMVDQSGTIVATLATGRYMRGGAHPVRTLFTWNGREDNGRVAPDGTYYIRVALLHQGRTLDIASPAGTLEPVTVRTVPPHPVVTGVTPLTYPQPSAGKVTIHYTGNEHRGATVLLYRTDLPGGPKLIKQFPTPWNGQAVDWNATVRNERPAPQGVYLFGLQVTDAACNTGRFPATIPPAPGSTPHAGVTVQYLAATPPLDPIPAGGRALVQVDALSRPYTWSLRRAGNSTPVAAGDARSDQLRVPVPAGGAGLYELSLRSGGHATEVPIVASADGTTGGRVTSSAAAGAAAAGAPTATPPAKLLVVLPALTWQGLNPQDGDGDGLPDTLTAGLAVALARPLLDGLPAGFDDEAGLLAYLDSAQLAYDLTTDVGLIDGRGPQLSGYSGVVLAGSETWLPASMSSRLRAYVLNGGRVLSLGIDSLRASVTVQLPVAGSLLRARALDPTQPTGADVFGARAGRLVTHNSHPITAVRDGLGIFTGTTGAWPGFASYEPIASVQGATIASDAGAGTGAGPGAGAGAGAPPAIAGFRLGHGVVVEIGIAGFGSSLQRSPDSQQLLHRLWTVLAA